MIITFNCDGIKHEISSELITSCEGRLKDMLTYSNYTIFQIDRNNASFTLVLDYYRYNNISTYNKEVLKYLILDAEYFRLPELKTMAEKLLSELECKGKVIEYHLARGFTYDIFEKDVNDHLAKGFELRENDLLIFSNNYFFISMVKKQN